MKKHLVLIGRGRLATHLKAAWSEFNLGLWDRTQPLELLSAHLKTADLILLAISDGALAEFFETHRGEAPTEARWVHFSGALVIPGMLDLHPLMTFGPDLYEPEIYQRMPFVSCELQKFPTGLALKNPLYAIKPKDKARYHATCVLGGNFTNLLWRKAIAEFALLGLPPDVAEPYAQRALKNVFENPKLALTGPLVRGDLATQEKNLEALGTDPYANVYRAFQKAYLEENQ